MADESHDAGTPRRRDDEPLLPRPGAAPRWVQSASGWVAWFGPWRLVATAASVVGIAVGGWLLVRPPPTPTEAALPFVAGTGSSAPASPPVESTVTSVDPSVVGASSLPSNATVHVAGAVARPGVYTLPPGSLVNDAVIAAGGATRRADLDAVNLAAPLTDGSQVFVPEPGQTPPVAAAPTPASSDVPAPGSGDVPVGSAPAAGPIDLNTAGVDELDVLPGVGPATATAIVEHREQQGPFLAVDDLEDVAGIGPAKLEAVRDLVTV